MYFYAAPLFCWLIQSISASSKLRQESGVRTRPRLAPRVAPFEAYGDGGRRPNEPPVYGGASGGRQPIYEEPIAGADDSTPQQGSLFDLTQQSHGIDVSDINYWSDTPLGDWQRTNNIPTYGDTGFPEMIIAPYDQQPNVPAKLEVPASVRSRSKRPAISQNKRGPKRKPDPDLSQLSGDSENAVYLRRRAQVRQAQRDHRDRKAAYIKSLEDKDIKNQGRIQELERQVAILEGRALSSYTSDNPSERDRLVISEADYQRSLLESTASGISVPVGEPEGGFYITAEEDIWQTSGLYMDYNNWGLEIGPYRKLARSHRYNNDGSIKHNTNLYTRRRSTPTQNPSTDSVAEFKYYADVYTQLRSNVSELLFPYFSNILSHTNSSSIYEMLRSVYSDLVAAGPWTIGPYSNGADCFDWIEEQLFGNITNSTLRNDTIIGVFVNHDILIKIYSDIWGNASQIANQTGYLKQMSTVRTYLNPTNTSLLPDTWKIAQPLPKSLDFGALYGKYNKTLSR